MLTNEIIIAEIRAGVSVGADFTVDGYAVSISNPMPVAVINAVDINFDGTQDVNVQNWPLDPANATNQTTANGKLDSIITKLAAGLPTTLPGGLLPVVEANSELIRVENAQLNAKFNSENKQAVRLPTTGYTTSTSGIVELKATSSLVFRFDVIYLGATLTGRWLQLHNAATATTPVTGTLVLSRPINTSVDIIEIEFNKAYPFTSGVKLVISSTKDTTTTEAAESFKASMLESGV